MLTPVFRNNDLSSNELTIINAALNLAMRSDPDTLSMTQIQKAAGVSKSTLYQYFGNKLDLWAAILMEEEQERMQASAELLASQASEEAWCQFFSVLTSFPRKLTVLQQMEVVLHAEEVPSERYRQWQVRRSKYLTNLVLKIQEQGLDEHSAQQRVAVLHVMLEGWQQLYRVAEFRLFCSGRQVFSASLARQMAQLICSA